jgi:protein-S-isoprenylcysteine O-methyltransferase Ste14
MVHPDTLLIRWAWYVVIATWVVLAFRTKPTVARRWGSPRLAVIFLAVVLVTLGSRSGLASHQRFWTVTSPLSVLATSLVVLGAAFAIWARLTIGANWSGSVTLKQDHELIVGGPYRVVRHPIYTGLLAMGIGTVIMSAEPFGLLALGVAMAVLAVKIPQEEKLMTETFPDQYPQYRRRVKAIIPFLV